jgi:uncharacterized phage protein (TIGR02218 family)
MRTVPDALKAHLAGDATTVCHAWRVTRRDGTVLGFTDHDHALEFAGTTFLAASGFAASDWEQGSGLAASSGEVAGALTSSAIAEDDIALGKYDGARLEVFAVNWADPLQHMRLRIATIGEVKRSQGIFRAELRGIAHRLDESRGRIYSRRCDANFGDARCGRNAGSSDYRATGSVVAADVDKMTVDGLDGFAAGFFRYGWLRFTEGPNEGLKIDVESHRRSGGETVIHFWLPLAAAPEAGDAFEITAGCDKTFETCKAKFDNHRNFRGFPHMPGADFSYSYADGETEHDGRPLYE